MIGPMVGDRGITNGSFHMANGHHMDLTDFVGVIPLKFIVSIFWGQNCVISVGQEHQADIGAHT